MRLVKRAICSCLCGVTFLEKTLSYAAFPGGQVIFLLKLLSSSQSRET